MNAAFAFDEVRIVEIPPQSLSPAEFFAMPLAKRVRLVIAKAAVFMRGGEEIDAADALAQRRIERAHG
jgi:hypothetical protein